MSSSSPPDLMRGEPQPLDFLARQPLADVIAGLATDLERGLSAREAAIRLAATGRNEPAPISAPAWPQILLRQFSGKLILLLIAATLVTLLLREWLNAVAIGVTVLISAGFGFLNEYRSERAIAALHRLTARHAEVVRDGLHEEVPATEIVPGDLIAVADGDIVPADARVVEARGLLVNESILTGEPEAVAKSADPQPGSESATPVAALYAGTTVVAGSGRAVVAATGRRTMLGAIAAAVQGGRRRATPLEQRLEQLGDRLILVFLALCALLVLTGVLQGRDPGLVVQMAISLAVGAVPEGLPAVATTTLAVAVRRLARRQVLVRRLDAVETLGSTTVIVTDKTGTLTENRMALRCVLLADGREFRVQVQAGADGTLRTTLTTTAGAPLAREDEGALRRLLFVSALCSDAAVEFDTMHGWHVHGDPLEGAIELAAGGLGLDDAVLHAYPRLATEPFTSATRMMRTTHRTPEGGTLVAVKGAFEQVAILDENRHRQLAAEVHALSDAGFRVLAVAEGSGTGAAWLLGALVLEDPLREDAAEAVSTAGAAGIRLLLATGDHLATARTVADLTGMIGDGLLAVLGPEWDQAELDRIAVVARATHGQKEALVRALQARGEVVAMTGDGVNDAAALRSADVGVAVGPGATDVAIEAADLVLTDGRLFSLVDGIREGRQITRSLRQAIVYLLTASFATILFIALSMVVSRPFALSPIQILWLNLVVHVFPALALALSREPDSDISGPTRTLLPRDTWLEIAWRSVTVALTGLAVLFLGDVWGKDLSHTQTLAFVTLALALVGQVFLVGVYTPRAQPARLARLPLWGAAATSVALVLLAVYVPALRAALSLEPLDVIEWMVTLGCVVVGWNVNQVGVALIEWRMRRN